MDLLKSYKFSKKSRAAWKGAEWNEIILTSKKRLEISYKKENLIDSLSRISRTQNLYARFDTNLLIPIA